MHVLDSYEQKIHAGTLLADPAQANVLRALDELAGVLNGRHRKALFSTYPLGKALRKIVKLPFFSASLAITKKEGLRGLYIYGPVGRGKTLLMDMFFDAIVWPEPLKKRIHFHLFMQDVHRRMHDFHQHGKNLDDCAQNYAAETKLLCLDEFQVTNVADAMILGRFFTSLFEAGVVLVATSNLRPENLYENGLQRSLFLPFIDVLKTYCRDLPVAGEQDYRTRRLKGRPVFICPPQNELLERDFSDLTDGAEGQSTELNVNGKVVKIAKAAHGVAWMSAYDFDQQKLWIPEFEALAKNFPTLILTDVRAFTADENDRVSRFIAFIDVWYDHQAKLIISADHPLSELYKEGTLLTIFERTLSRLTEMQHDDWWERGTHK